MSEGNEEWSIKGKTCIVTGANAGIGKATTLELVKRGAGRVIMACRTLDKAEQVAKEICQQCGISEHDRLLRLAVKHLDLASLSSVRKFAKEIINSEQQVHVLINNAGLEQPNGRTVTEDGFETTFATNHLGHFLLTNLLLDLLKKSAPSRIVIVASTAYKACWPGGFDIDDVNTERVRYKGMQVYCKSKLANILFARSLNKRLNPTPEQHSGVSVFALHPGVINSEFRRYRRGFSLLDIFFIGAISIEDGAKTQLYCACQPGIEKLTGKYFEKCQETRLWSIGKDDEKAEKLWTMSEQMTGLSNTTTTTADQVADGENDKGQDDSNNNNN